MQEILKDSKAKKLSLGPVTMIKGRTTPRYSQCATQWCYLSMMFNNYVDMHSMRSIQIKMFKNLRIHQYHKNFVRISIAWMNTEGPKTSGQCAALPNTRDQVRVNAITHSE